MHITLATQDDIRQLVEAGLITKSQSYDPLRDITLVSHSGPGNLTGLLCLRPMFYAHSLNLARASRYVANALLAEARKICHSTGIHGSLFQVSRDNATMVKFLSDHHAIMESGSDLYRIDVLPPK